MNNKSIGLIYLGFGLVMGVLGWLTSYVIRVELKSTGAGVLVAENMNQYNIIVTMHALIMIFLMVIPTIYTAKANLAIPSYTNVQEILLPRLNIVALIIQPVSVVLILKSMVSEVQSGCGWTLYPPLSTVTEEQGNVDLLQGLNVNGFASTTTAFNVLLTVYQAHKKQTQQYQQTIVQTTMLLILVLPILTAALVSAIADIQYNTSFYDHELGGDCVLFQHLFWLFGHPEVYILILPAFGLINTYTTTEIYNTKIMILAIIVIGILGTLVWGHHMYMVSMDTDTKVYFNLVTMLIGIPTGLKVLTWIISA